MASHPRFPVSALCCLALALTLCPLSAKADMQSGLAAMREGDFDRALSEYSAPAENGDSLAQFYTGWILCFRNSFNRPRSEGLAMLEKSAAAGCAEAQFFLGRIYRMGLAGVTTDEKKARAWLERAWAKGFSRARLDLKAMDADPDPGNLRLNNLLSTTAQSAFAIGRMYEKGTGVSPDPAQAMAFYEQAAEGGDVRAMHKLALLTLSGKADGIPDHVSSMLWLNEAAPQEKNPMDRYEASMQRSIERRRREAEGGNAESQYLLGTIYENGTGVDKDYGEAFKWYGGAAAQNHGQALTQLGRLCLLGLGTEKNDKLALDCLRKAVEQDIAEACFLLARMLETGRGAKQDMEAARTLYEKAAQKGFVPAQNNLGILYLQDKTRAPEKALLWFTRAAWQGFAPSQFMLGNMYLQGVGTKQNIYRAYVWVALAARGGHKKAGEELPKIAALLDKGRLEAAQADVNKWRRRPEPGRRNQ